MSKKSSNEIQAMNLVTAIEENDVLLGRGRGSNNHPGNAYFRDLVLERKQDYMIGKNRRDKVLVAAAIVDDILMNRSGRFLTAGTKEGEWYNVNRNDAINKTKQALRDAKNYKFYKGVAQQLNGDINGLPTNATEVLQQQAHGTVVTNRVIPFQRYQETYRGPYQGHYFSIHMDREKVANDVANTHTFFNNNVPPFSNSLTQDRRPKHFLSMVQPGRNIFSRPGGVKLSAETPRDLQREKVDIRRNSDPEAVVDPFSERKPNESSIGNQQDRVMSPQINKPSRSDNKLEPCGDNKKKSNTDKKKLRITYCTMDGQRMYHDPETYFRRVLQHMSEDKSNNKYQDALNTMRQAIRESLDQEEEAEDFLKWFDKNAPPR